MEARMRALNQHEIPQVCNGNNGDFDYAAMIDGLIKLTDDSELLICLDKNGIIKHFKSKENHWLLSRGDELIGQCLWNLVPSNNITERNKSKTIFSQVIESKKPFRFEDEQNGCWFDNMVYPIFDKRGNVKQVLVIGRDITRSKKSEQEIKRLNECLEELVARRTEELANKARKLEELNTALRVLLQRREEEKKQGEQAMISAINQFIIPHVNQIQHNAKDNQTLACINDIDTALQQISIKFGLSIQSKAFGLTPSEIEIALFIKSGKSSKDIANMMKISHETVESHRKNIRRKIGLKGKKENLQAYLSSLDT
jgi:DNA-binding CsgD family transcriptional regulator